METLTLLSEQIGNEWMPWSMHKSFNTYDTELAVDTLTRGGGCWEVPLALGTLTCDYKKQKYTSEENIKIIRIIMNE